MNPERLRISKIRFISSSGHSVLVVVVVVLGSRRVLRILFAERRVVAPARASSDSTRDVIAGCHSRLVVLFESWVNSVEGH